MLALAFPNIDPVFVTLGPLTIRWYALAYLAAFVIGWRVCLWLARQNAQGPSPQMFDEFLTWAVIGTILGGRCGYVLFYQFYYFLKNPLEIFYVWHGGMSFHGGLLGVIIAAFLFARQKKISFFALSDLLAVVTPIGLGLGRVANFINGELFGRAADVPWAVVFPRGGDVPRHPSQLYEAGMEGVLLFVILAGLSQIPFVRRHYGLLSGIFLIDYAVFRIIAEFFREPDEQLGFLFGGATMGHLLSVPMILVGIAFIVHALRRKA